MWYEKVGRNRWRLTEELVFETLFGEVRAPVGYETDFFSLVPDTRHDEFKKQSVLHDRMRETHSRIESDIAFLLGMVEASVRIYRELIDSGANKRRAQKELLRLLRVSCLYMLGVSGKIGSLYIWFSRLR